MSSLREVRDAIGRQITKAIPQLTYTPVLTGNTQLPAVVVAVPFDTLEYHGTFGRTGQWGQLSYRVGVALNPTELITAVDTATAFAEASGPLSIYKAIMDDTTLGRVIGTDGCCVERGAGITYEEAGAPGGGPAHLLVSFIVTVVMPKES